MRDKPTLRIPLGILALLAVLAVYALAVMWASQWIGRLPTLLAGARLPRARRGLAAAAAALPDLDGNRPLGLRPAGADLAYRVSVPWSRRQARAR